MTGCPHPKNLVYKDGKQIFLACKQWKCPHCAKVRKYQLMHRFEVYKDGGSRYRMITLTEWKNPTNHDNAKQLSEHWNRLRASLRKHGYIINDYVWVKEYKPLYGEEDIGNDKATDHYDIETLRKYMSGEIEELLFYYPHIHVLIPLRVPLHLLKRLWFLATNQTANQVHAGNDIDVIKNPVAYMTKYFTKSDMLKGFSPRERRYGFSRKYPAKLVSNVVIIDGVKYAEFYAKKETDYYKFLSINHSYTNEYLINWEKSRGGNERLAAVANTLKECEKQLKEWQTDRSLRTDEDYQSLLINVQQMRAFLDLAPTYSNATGTY